MIAICKDPRGIGFGFEHNKPDDVEKDGFKQVSFTYKWAGEQTGDVIINAERMSPSISLKKALVVPFGDANAVSFLVGYSKAVWLHTVYTIRSVVVISQHSEGRGMTENSAAGRIFYAPCEVSFQ